MNHLKALQSRIGALNRLIYRAQHAPRPNHWLGRWMAWGELAVLRESRRENFRSLNKARAAQKKVAA